MPKQLVVLDDPVFRSVVLRSLERSGGDVRAAASFREALAEAITFHPDVLIGECRSSGLRAGIVLRALYPELRSVLLVEPGRGSRELPGHLELLETPFDAARLRAAVERSQPVEDLRQLPIGLAILGPARTILHANPAARRRFSETYTGRNTTSLDAAVSLESQLALERGPSRWVRLYPEAPEPIHWYARCRHWPERKRTLLALLSESERGFMEHPVAELLFEGRLPTSAGRHLLIVDADPSYPQLVEAAIAAIGGVVRRATSTTEALRAFEREPAIRRVLLDYETIASRARELTLTLRALRPGTRLIGTSHRDRRQDFASLEIRELIAKPWHLLDIVSLFGAAPDALHPMLEAESF